MKKLPTILSGMQPSGPLHIGNYLGALKNWVALQNSGDYNCIFSIVDYHTLTGNMSPEERKQHIVTLAAEYIAAGIDPEKSTIFVQSHVPEHTELAWIFSNITPMAELERMTQFKDKSTKQNKNINVGLFTYPVLMAADVLLYHATHVPVGKDQVQHLELTNDTVRWFNNKYKTNYFLETKPLLTDVPKAQSLLAPDKKMSKSWGDGHVINMSDDPKIIEKKLKKAVTASEGGKGETGATNLIELLKHFGSEAQYKQYKAAEKDGSIRYGDLKKDLSTSIAEHFAEFRERRAELLENHDELAEILMDGAKRANEIASKTIEEVREIVGVR